MLKERIAEMTRYKQIKSFLDRNNRFLVPTFLLAGTALDYFTFRTISIRTSFYLLGAYAIVTGAIICFIHIYDEKRNIEGSKLLGYTRLYTPLVLQFLLGNLLSASLIFYWFSGAISVSWPIILVVAGLMVSNELLRDYFERRTVQILIFYFILFSLCSLFLPYGLNSISAFVFVLAGLLSLVLMFGYVKTFSRWLPDVKKDKRLIWSWVFVIFFAMNALYFFNLIPPIPLSMREAIVAHSVTRTDGNYALEIEKQAWYLWLIPGKTDHVNASDQLVVFTSVFAPANLDTTIVHHWQWYNSDTHKWVDRGEYSYALVGGRNDGYRGYTMTTNPADGKWRVSVETKRGQVVGRVRFTVKQTDETIKLIETIK
ncbi:MAG: DUF2914 domain-containing protein [Patescibacteria group bacterium]